MTSGTHILFGVVVASALKLPIVPAMIGSILPDMDLKKGLPFRQNRTLFNSHRGITHHPIIPIMLFMVYIYISQNFPHEIVLNKILLSFDVGYASHLLLDMLNPLGIPFTFSYYPRLSFKITRTGGIGEVITAVCLICALIELVNKHMLTLNSIIGKDYINLLLKMFRGG